jgi:hypothetical protein
MKFDPDIAKVVEVHLKQLVKSVKGVRNIQGSSLHDLGTYRISFDYQRRGEVKRYLLIHNPKDERVTFCAIGGFGNTPQNVRKQLLSSLGTENYRMEHKSHLWTEVSTDDLCSNNIFPYKWIPLD